MKSLLLLLLFSAPLILSSCTGRQNVVELGNVNQVLHIGIGSEPQDLDPHVVTGVPEFKVLSALMEGLVSVHPETLEPDPGVAERWELSEDLLTYTFYLRPNAQWSNGDPVTAEDFAYAFRRILSPGLGAEYAYMLYVMKNARAYHEGTISDPDALGVRVLDPHTLQVQMEGPTPYFISLLNHYAWYPVHRATIEAHGKIDERGTGWTRPENFVGNGPFRMTEWDINQSIVSVKNPHYWDQAKVQLNAIHFYAIESEDTEERAFRSNQLHISSNLPISKIPGYKADHPEQLRSHNELSVYYYSLNVNSAPLDDLRIRRALSLSIDRTAITDKLLRRGDLPARCITPPQTGGYMAPERMEEDVDQARALLAEAGYPGGQGMPAIELLYNTLESHRTIAEALQQMWKETLGVEVVLMNQEWKVYLDSLHKHEFQMARAGWTGDYNDPNTFLDMFTTGAGNNHSGWSNPRYDTLINQAAQTADPIKRFEFFQEAETLLLTDVPVIPIYFRAAVYLVRPEVRGWHDNILNVHPYKYVYLKADDAP